MNPENRRIPRLRLIAAGAVALCLYSPPAEGQLVKRLKECAAERIRHRVEEAVDRSVDGALDTAEGAARNRSHPTATAPAGSAVSATPAPVAEAAPPAIEPRTTASLPAGQATAPPAAKGISPDTSRRRLVGPVRPARRGAAAGFRDDDLAWLLPLLAAQAADEARMQRLTSAIGGGSGPAIVDDVIAGGQGMVQRLRSGQADPLTLLKERVDPRHVVVPPGARYDAACSVAVTETNVMLMDHGVSAVFTLGAEAPPGVLDELIRATASGNWEAADKATLEAMAAFGSQPALRNAIAWYRAHGFDYVAKPKPAWAHVLGPSAAKKALTVGVWEINILHPPYTVVQDDACKHLPSGPLIVLSEPVQGVGALVQGRIEGLMANDPERLPGALRQAGLSEEEWGDVLVAVGTAEIDARNPQLLQLVDTDPAEQHRRRANLDWYQRQQAELGPWLRAASPPAR